MCDYMYQYRNNVERMVLNVGRDKAWSYVKGLYDSGLIDMLLNRHLADVFTKVHMDLPNLLLTVLLIVTVAVGFVNIGMWFI